MPAPETLITADELCLAYSRKLVKQLMPREGSSDPDPDRVRLALLGATSHIFGKVQIQLELASIDEWWDAPTTKDRDRASLKTLALESAAYYLRKFGQGGEEIPPDIIDGQNRVDARLAEIAEHFATIGSKTQPKASTQNERTWTTGCGRHPAGSPRSRWGGF